MQKREVSKKKVDAPKKSTNPHLGMIYIFAFLFLMMAGYLAYFIAFEADNVVNNAYNRRQNYFAEKVIRGDILASDGTVLATTDVQEDGTEVRRYPYGKTFSHVVGYTSNGKGGVESLANFSLLTSDENMLTQMMQEFKGEKKNGNTVTTTLDMTWQQAAYDALTSKEGAVVVLEPSTGKILSLVSKPDFEPAQLEELLAVPAEDKDKDSFLVNRATQGLYAPGSTFKMITLLEYFRENQNLDDFSYECDGVIDVGNYDLHCSNHKSHGNLTLKSAFAKSCNGAFASIGLGLDISKLNKLTDSLLFHAELPLALPYNKSSFTLSETSTDFEVAQTVIGQGETLVSPMHMAMIMSAIANDGILMQPYVVEKVESEEGKTVDEAKPEKYGNLISATEADILVQYLSEVTASGTASRLQSENYDIYGKTGTAQTGVDGVTNSWFVGCVTVEKQQYVICVLAANIAENDNNAVIITNNLLKYAMSEK